MKQLSGQEVKFLVLDALDADGIEVTNGTGNVLWINFENGQEFAIHIDENKDDR